MKGSTIVLGIAAVGALAAALYFSTKKTTPQTATSGQPINALPARTYALNPNYNPQAQPPVPTFTPFSGVPIVENLLRAYQSSASDSSQGMPVSFDTTDTSSVTDQDSGTTTFFG